MVRPGNRLNWSDEEWRFTNEGSSIPPTSYGEHSQMTQRQTKRPNA